MSINNLTPKDISGFTGVSFELFLQSNAPEMENLPDIIVKKGIELSGLFQQYLTADPKRFVQSFLRYKSLIEDAAGAEQCQLGQMLEGKGHSPNEWLGMPFDYKRIAGQGYVPTNDLETGVWESFLRGYNISLN